MDTTTEVLVTDLDEVEYGRLAEDIQRIEKALASGEKPGNEFLLKGYLLNAKGRLAEIRTETVRGDDLKRDEKTRENAAVARLVEGETRLNAVEKEQYAGFLAEDFFTKSDFLKLDKFYAETWGRLSETGRTEMSHRVWEGIRHNEYAFDELPETVRKKEAERLYQQLTAKAPADKSLENIPPQDRADFIREHETGDQNAATQVLCRDSFSKNVSIHSSKEVSQRDTSYSEKSSEGKIDADNSKIQTEMEEAAAGNLAAPFDETLAVKPTQLPSAGGASVVR